MSGKRIVIEKACPVHGLYDQPPHTAYGGCIGSTRRTLTEGQYVLIEKVDGEWPEWAVGYLDGELFETDDDEGQLARVVLDALSDHTEGTP